MSEENIPGRKLKKITGVTDLSTAIEKLEKKKAAIEDDFKEKAHHFIENLNPVKLLDRTLQNVKESSPSKYSLFKEALAFGAGYISKRKLIHQLKNSLLNTFRIPNNSTVAAVVKADDEGEKENEFTQIEENSKEMNKQNQIEKVKAMPETLPEPTYWPFFLALGLVFLGWGLLTTWLISLAGFIILVASLTGWINILRHE